MSARLGNVRRCLALLALVSAAANTTFGQRLLVRTETLAAAGAATRVYIHSVDMRRKEVLPGGEAAPGSVAVGPMLLSPNGLGAVASSGPAESGGENDLEAGPTFISGYRTAPFDVEPRTALVAAPGWRHYAVCMTSAPESGRALLVGLATRVDNLGIWRGRLETWDCGSGSGLVWPESTASYVLPGAAVDAVVIGKKGMAAVLCRGLYGEGAFLHVFDLVTGKPQVESRAVRSQDAIGTDVEGRDMAVSRDGAYLLVVTSGHTSSRPDGEAVSWLHVFSTRDFKPRREVLELPGVESAMFPSPGGVCRLVTQSPGTGFGYVLTVRYSANTLRIEAEVPLTGVSGSLRIAPSPAGVGVAVGMGRRFELWPQGEPHGVARQFDAPVDALIWTDEGLFLGEADRVLQVDTTTGKPSASVTLPGQRVCDILPIPSGVLPRPDRDADGLSDPEERRLGTSPDSADTDKDGIPDGSDAEPLVPSPRLTTPAWLTLDGAAAGQQAVDVPITSPFGGRSTWQVYWERQTMPWLIVRPTSGPVGSSFQVEINPDRYRRPEHVLTGNLRVYMTGTDITKAATGSPATIGIWVVPPSAPLPRILWMWESQDEVGHLRDAEGTQKLDVLADVLAAPPLTFSYREVSGAYVQSLRSNTIVVMTAGAAMRGAITRHDVLENYVAQGGGLLFIGAYQPGGGDEGIAQWLAPAGIHIDTGTRVDGVFNTVPDSDLCRWLPRVTVRNGCGLRVDDARVALAPTTPHGNQTAFVAVRYGAGRIAALAAATPLEDTALQLTSNRMFASDLFRWLGGFNDNMTKLGGKPSPEPTDSADAKAKRAS